jgi:hypothetical protein
MGHNMAKAVIFFSTIRPFWGCKIIYRYVKNQPLSEMTERNGQNAIFFYSAGLEADTGESAILFFYTLTRFHKRIFSIISENHCRNGT